MAERSDQSYGSLVYFQLVIVAMAITPLFWSDTMLRTLFWAAVVLLEFLLIREFLKRRGARTSRRDEAS